MSVRVEIIDEFKMRKYISIESQRIIGEKDFIRWKNYLEVFFRYVDNGGKIEDRSSKDSIESTTSVVLGIEEDEYECFVDFIKVLDFENSVYLIDMNYNYNVEEMWDFD